MKSFFRMSYPYILWIGFFIVAPMFMILLYAVTKGGNNTLTFHFTLENFGRFFSDPDFMRVLWTSLRIAFITTVVCILIGYPAALFIANLSERKQTMMILLMTLYFLRMVFCSLLAASAPFWLMIALTGAWLVRAQLSALETAGGKSPLYEVPRGLRKHHWYLAAGAMVVAGFLHPFGILLGFSVSWALACLAGNICRDSISGVNVRAVQVFGYAAELVMLFLGILFYASF